MTQPPLPRPPSVSLPVPGALRAGPGAQRVLVVDDSRSIRTLLKIYLAGRAFDFVEAESAEEALQLLQAQPVDLVLTDLYLEGMSGADLAARIRGDARLRRTPVLMISGERDPQRLAALARSAGVDAVLPKPISCNQLMGLVDRLLPPQRRV
ncbi:MULTISPECIES: response regulator [Myxococcaceae]|uniref:response regulator n=1 Tax=Myxococcaceae TaxID=31 RepID=UPI00129C8571|nr:response regulator [Simulacricoccus sp. 17bor-14]